MILKRFKHKEIERPSSSESSTSILSASDWRKIKRLLRQTVEDIYDKRSQQLSYTIHALAVREQLLEHENKCLRDALYNEKKRWQRGKPLPLIAPPEYHGGAVF